MIRSWRVAHFKSFREPPELKLSAINVIAGANSSGKSSIIQSILLLKQTLQYGAMNRSVTLNGPLLRLGSFEDVRNFQSPNSPIGISLDIVISEVERQRTSAQSWMRLLRRHGGATENKLPTGIRLDVAFDQQTQPDNLSIEPSKSTLSPKLVHGKITVERNASDGATFEAFQTYKLPHISVAEENASFSSYIVTFDNASKSELLDKKPNSTISGGSVSHFLPSWSVVQYNSTAFHAIKIVDYIFSDSLNYYSQADIGYILPDSVIALIDEFLTLRNLKNLGQSGSVTAESAKKVLQPIIFRANIGAGSLFKSLQTDEGVRLELQTLRDQALAAMLANEQNVNWDFEFETPQLISAATEFLREFFKAGVRYLGPLRDSPRPVYQPEALESTTDVGYRGEHTAAVLDLNGNSMTNFYLPPDEDSEDDYYLNAQRSRLRLRDAVKIWLRYLGVAVDVETSDAGVYGNRLQVKTSNEDRAHDLTNVGVGVSQVLPLVVMALLAKPGSFLIFEQPELHLHPKVQARLADLFIALAKDGKQSLLETHSEYLVDRLRLRIALAQTSDTNKLINILFSEKRGSESNFVAVEVNEYGAINNWPADFFEQSNKDVSRILKAASLRRKNMRNSK